MLVLKRKEGQWLELKGNAEKFPELAQLFARLRVQNIKFNPRTGKGEVDLVLDDDEHYITAQRPERNYRTTKD